jgi:hypothetical protein
MCRMLHGYGEYWVDLFGREGLTSRVRAPTGFVGYILNPDVCLATTRC